MRNLQFSSALAAMAGAGLIIGTAQSAHADTTTAQALSFSVSESASDDSYGLSASQVPTPVTANASQLLIFDGFDTTLGTLTNVNVTVISPSFSGSASITGSEGGTTIRFGRRPVGGAMERA